MSKRITATLTADFDGDDLDDLNNAVDEALNTLSTAFANRGTNTTMTTLVYSADNRIVGHGTITEEARS